MAGVAAANATSQTVLTTGVAGLCAGAMSMAVGEFLSVSTQRDTELATIATERRELATSPDDELHELTGIYEARGLDSTLARQVAEQLSAHDNLAAHLRDELGIDAGNQPRPWQAAWVSAVTFATFALVPIIALLAAPTRWRLEVIAAVTLVALATLGALGARLGGARPGPAMLRVTLGGGLAMAVTTAVGHLIGAAI